MVHQKGWPPLLLGPVLLSTTIARGISPVGKSILMLGKQFECGKSKLTVHYEARVDISFFMNISSKGFLMTYYPIGLKTLLNDHKFQSLTILFFLFFFTKKGENTIFFPEICVA